MKETDWNAYAKMCPYLKGLAFYRLGSTSIVDTLIGLDCSDLHFSVKDVWGNPGESAARLTPLGWTCVGTMEGQSQDDIRTIFILSPMKQII